MVLIAVVRIAMVRVAMVQSWEEEPWYVAIASESTNSTRNLAHIDEAAVTRRTARLGVGLGLRLGLGLGIPKPEP